MYARVGGGGGGVVGKEKETNEVIFSQIPNLCSPAITSMPLTCWPGSWPCPS